MIIIFKAMLFSVGQLFVNFSALPGRNSAMPSLSLDRVHCSPLNILTPTLLKYSILPNHRGLVHVIHCAARGPMKCCPHLM